MKSLLYIFIGGGTGSVLRYLLTIAIQRQTGTLCRGGRCSD